MPPRSRAPKDDLPEFKELLRTTITTPIQLKRLLELYQTLSERRAIFDYHLMQIENVPNKVEAHLVAQPYDGKTILKELFRRIVAKNRERTERTIEKIEPPAKMTMRPDLDAYDTMSPEYLTPKWPKRMNFG